MKKGCLLCWLLCLLCFMLSPGAEAEDIQFDTPITMTVNKTLIHMDTRPFLYEGTTFVPIRFVSEALGAESVIWDSSSDSAIIAHKGTEIVLPAGKDVGYINGQKVTIDHGVILANDRLFVPVRFVSEALQCQVDWIYETYTVDIQKEGITVPEELVGYRSYTDDEIYWLSKIIHAESQGEPMAGKIAVGNVILNRVASRDYPNTIYGVIFDRNHGVQFSPVLDGSIYQKPLGDSIIAAKHALEGKQLVSNCLFFFNPKTAQSQWIANNRTYYTTIRNHDFYL
ncbi:MAG: copper amine oxidase [Ruminococcaceae bacterium]|nr:copper amine oxidase [Oscillospiraceae bacterium]